MVKGNSGFDCLVDRPFRLDDVPAFLNIGHIRNRHARHIDRLAKINQARASALPARKLRSRFVWGNSHLRQMLGRPHDNLFELRLRQ